MKAECDVCVTSGNVYHIIETLPTDKIFFVPDNLMGKNIINEMEKRGVKKDIKLWHGTCYVHEEYNPEMIEVLRNEYKGVKVLAHPECSPGVLHHSDFVGSTAQLLRYMDTTEAESFLMLTECGQVIGPSFDLGLSGGWLLGRCFGAPPAISAISSMELVSPAKLARCSSVLAH